MTYALSVSFVTRSVLFLFGRILFLIFMNENLISMTYDIMLTLANMPMKRIYKSLEKII